MRIVIAEDAAVIRAGLTEILTDRGHEIVAAVGDAGALLAAVAAYAPDVAIVDVRMPPDHTDEGLRAAIAIRRAHPAVGILVFSQYVETRYAADLLRMRSGGVGYLLKDRVANVAEFDDAITRVAAGGTALDPEVVTGLLSATRHTAALDTLTPRERDVLALMAEGRSNGAIAERFSVSERAVEKHISNIFSKLGLPPVRLRPPPRPGRSGLPRRPLTPSTTASHAPPSPVRRPSVLAALRWAARKRRISWVCGSVSVSSERAMAASMSFRSPAVV